MEIEVAASSEVAGPTMPIDGGVGADAEGFGTRVRTDRPHSMNLFGARHSTTRDNGERALDLLVGVGIGAAAMYYFDPNAGARRRAATLDRIVDVVTMATQRHDALGAAVALLGSVLLGRGVTNTGSESPLA
jgi:hypothetical protein